MNHHDYYSAAAQVIPVLLFVAIFERRALEVGVYKRRWLSYGEAFLYCLTIATFVGGEAAALHGLDHPLGTAGRALVNYTIGYLLTMVGALAIGVALQPLAEAILNERQRKSASA
jgi:hypothetical protein